MAETFLRAAAFILCAARAEGVRDAASFGRSDPLVIHGPCQA